MHSLILMPQKYVAMILQGVHDFLGHLGETRVLEMTSQRFDRPRLRQDVIDWVASCPTCQSFKGPVPGFRWKLRNIQVTRQNQVVQMDFEILPKTKNGYQYILIIIDHFSKFAQAHAVKDMTAATVAGIIWSKWIFLLWSNGKFAIRSRNSV